MKKWTLMLALLLAVPVCAFAAPDRMGRTDIGLDISGAIATDSEINATTYIGGNMSYGIKEWFAMGVSLGWANFGSDDTTVGALTVPGPDITAYPFFVDFIVRVPAQRDQAFVPYGVLGLGAIFWDSDSVTASNGAQIDANIDTSFGVKLGAGVDWFLNDNWILNFNANYVFTNADLTVSSGAVSASDNVELDYWNIGGGLKYLY